MPNKLKTQKSISILPNGCFIFSKSVPLKHFKTYRVYNINLDNSSVWVKPKDHTKTNTQENFELFGYRNKFKIQ
tara:strand:+ start:1070 stop:1291 length:222 start_codon:yes stop_codon:yes gene_type:complete